MQSNADFFQDERGERERRERKTRRKGKRLSLLRHRQKKIGWGAAKEGEAASGKMREEDCS